MPVIGTPARRRGITTIPEKVSVSFDAPLNPDGSRPITAEEQHALERILDPTPGVKTFADRVAPVVALCRRIIERHGGRRQEVDPPGGPPIGWMSHAAGYLVPSPEEASECDFALNILSRLNHAQSNDIDIARQFAWEAGQLLVEAQMKFTWESHALRGEKISRSAREGGKARAHLLQQTSRARAWRAEVANRPRGVSKAAVHARIARLEGRKPAAVKKAIQRASKSKK